MGCVFTRRSRSSMDPEGDLQAFSPFAQTPPHSLLTRWPGTKEDRGRAKGQPMSERRLWPRRTLLWALQIRSLGSFQSAAHCIGDAYRGRGAGRPAWAWGSGRACSAASDSPDSP